MEINADQLLKPFRDSPKPRNLFSHTLRQLRLEHGLKQRELASLACLDQAYVCGLESGSRPVPADKLVVRLSEAMELPPSLSEQLYRSAIAARLQSAFPEGPTDSYWQMYMALLPHVMCADLVGIINVVGQLNFEVSGCAQGGINR